MAAKTKSPVDDGITSASPVKNTVDNEPRVRITLPLLEEEEGLKVDQTEQVVINGGVVTNIRRGTPVDVKASVFMLLKQRYP